MVMASNLNRGRAYINFITAQVRKPFNGEGVQASAGSHGCIRSLVHGSFAWNRIRPPACLPAFPYTARRCHPLFCCGYKWPNHILFLPMRKKGLGMNELDRVVISGAGPGIGKAVALEIGCCGIDVSCVSRTTNCEITCWNRFVRLFNFGNAMPIRLEG